MSSSIHNASTPKASSDVRGEPASPHAPSAADRNQFECAIVRAVERRASGKPGERDDNDDEPSRDAQAAAAAAAGGAQGLARSADEGANVAEWASLSSLAAPLFASSPAAEAAPSNPAFGLEQFSAALSRLQMPASAQGPQQWQFSMAERSGGPVLGVRLNASAAGPWQMTVHSSARDRQALHANLDKLHARLRSRGAHVGDVQVRLAEEDEP
jgi:hypothetical protein